MVFRVCLGSSARLWFFGEPSSDWTVCWVVGAALTNDFIHDFILTRIQRGNSGI